MRQAAWGGAGLLALAAVRYVVKRSKLRNGRVPVTAGEPPVAAPGDAVPAPGRRETAAQANPPPSMEVVRDLEWPRYVALCNAYYEKREFRVEPICRDADGSVDAKLYFRKLPESVAVMRYEARTGEDAGLEAMGELCDIMARNRIARGILHSQGRFGAEAVELARLSRIQLVSRDDLVSKLSRLPPDMQQELLQVAAAHPVAA